MVKYRSASVPLTLAIIGCVLAAPANAAEEPGLGTMVPEAEMTMFCQNAAAARFGGATRRHHDGSAGQA